MFYCKASLSWSVDVILPLEININTLVPENFLHNGQGIVRLLNSYKVLDWLQTERLASKTLFDHLRLGD